MQIEIEHSDYTIVLEVDPYTEDVGIGWDAHTMTNYSEMSTFTNYAIVKEIYNSSINYDEVVIEGKGIVKTGEDVVHVFEHEILMELNQ